MAYVGPPILFPKIGIKRLKRQMSIPAASSGVGLRSRFLGWHSGPKRCTSATSLQRINSSSRNVFAKSMCGRRPLTETRRAGVRVDLTVTRFSTSDKSFRPLTRVFRPNTSAFDLRRSVFKKSMCGQRPLMEARRAGENIRVENLIYPCEGEGGTCGP